LPKKLFVGLGVSPDEKIFTTTDERGFFPYTPHPFGHRPSIYIGFAEKAFRGVRSEYSVFRCGFSVHCSQQNTPHFPTSLSLLNRIYY